MMLLQPHVEEIQKTAAYYPLPSGLVPEIRGSSASDDVHVFEGIWANTGQTTLAWRWIRPAGPPISGELTWPHSYHAAEDHAAKLLEIAEAGMIDGCAPIVAPAIDAEPALPIRGNPRDQRIDDEFANTEKALGAWKRVPRCANPARR